MTEQAIAYDSEARTMQGGELGEAGDAGSSMPRGEDRNAEVEAGAPADHGCQSPATGKEFQTLRLEDFLSEEARRFMQRGVPQFPIIEDIYSVGAERRSYVIYTNPKCEEKAHERVIGSKLEAYFPKSTTWRKRSRRQKHQKEKKVKISRPLFPRYIMIDMPVDDRGNSPFGLIREIDGVKEFVGVAGKPLALRASEIKEVRRREEAGDFDDTRVTGKVITPKWVVEGAMCQVIKGPFASFPGVIKECLSGERIKVGVNIFDRLTLLELDIDHVAVGC